MDYKALKWSVHDNPNNPGEPCIGVITLNRPEKLNAVDPLMRLELDALCNEIARNSIIKVVILTGEGRGFCAGGDLKSEGEVLGAFEGSMGITGPYKEMAEYFFNDLRHRVLQSAMRKLEDLPQVTIAAINGPAVGVGLEMATLCDMRIASDRARFGEVAVPAGFVPESGGARNLPKLIGIGRAMRLILTGEIIDAKEALRIGLGRRSRAGCQTSRLRRSLLPGASRPIRIYPCAKPSGWSKCIGTGTAPMKVISRSSTPCSKLPEPKTAKKACAPSWRSARRAILILTMPTGRFRKRARQKNEKIANDDGFAEVPGTTIESCRRN